jgi:hypothetical protein
MTAIVAFGIVMVAPARGAPDVSAPAAAASAVAADRTPVAHWVVDPAIPAPTFRRVGARYSTS